MLKFHSVCFLQLHKLY